MFYFLTHKTNKIKSVAQSNPLMPLHSNWSSLKFRHGIAPTKVYPTSFVNAKYCPGWNKYWRDIPSRKSMELRVKGYQNKLHLKEE